MRQNLRKHLLPIVLWKKKIVALPPLEEGEVFLKDKDPFGEVVELQGNHIVEPDTFYF